MKNRITLIIIFIINAISQASFANHNYDLCFEDIHQEQKCLPLKDIVVRIKKTYPTVFVKIDVLKVVMASRYTQVDPFLIISMAYTESRFNHDANNKKSGAYGVMQILPTTRQYILNGPKNTFDWSKVKENMHDNDYLKAAVYLKYLSKRHRFNWIEAIVAYNEGPRRVKNRRKEATFAQNHTYLKRVLREYTKLTSCELVSTFF